MLAQFEVPLRASAVPTLEERMGQGIGTCIFYDSDLKGEYVYQGDSFTSPQTEQSARHGWPESPCEAADVPGALSLACM